MTGLVEWLRAALDEQERIARSGQESHTHYCGINASMFHETSGPAFVLRTVQAHREILDRHEPQKNSWGELECAYESAERFLTEPEPWPCPDVVSLAGIYRESFPGFDPSRLGES